MLNSTKRFYNSQINKTTGRRVANKIKNMRNTSAKFVKNNLDNVKRMSIWQIIWIILIIIIIIIIIIYWAINVSSNRKMTSSSRVVLVGPETNAYSLKKNKQSIYLPENGGGLSFSTWIYIQDWNYNFANRKYILDCTISGSNKKDKFHIPGIWLYAKTNALAIRTSTDIDSNEGCDIQNIPLQKWINIVYVLSNRTVDIYINGKLERSCVLKGIPKWSSVGKKANVFICSQGGFYGRISSTEYYNYAISMNKINTIYSSGPHSIKKISKKNKNEINEDYDE